MITEGTPEPLQLAIRLVWYRGSAVIFSLAQRGHVVLRFSEYGGR